MSFEPIKNSQSQEAPTSNADYIWLVDDDPKGLCEPVKSPSVMKAVADSLPAHGIKLTWASCQSLLPIILAKVSVLFPVSYIIGTKRDVCRPHYIWVCARWNGIFLLATITGLWAVS